MCARAWQAFGKHGGNRSLSTVWPATNYGEFAVNWRAADAQSVVALFLLVRGRHWFLGVPPFADARVVPQELQLDWSPPLDPVMRQAHSGVFSRRWTGGTASFDCATQQGSLQHNSESIALH